MNPATCVAQIPFILQDTTPVNDNQPCNMMTFDEVYPSLNLNNIKVLTDYKILNIDNYNEYVCNVKMDDIIRQENLNGNYHLVPNVPLNLMPPPPHNMTNNLTVHHFSRRGSWKSRGELRSNSPNGSESDESCRSYTSHESPADIKRPNQNFTRNRSSFVNNSLLYNNNNNKYNNKSNIFYNTQYQTNQHQNNHKTRNNNHQRRESNKRPHNIYRRVYGLMERFTSRSSLFRITASPTYLIADSKFDQLSQSVWDVYCVKVQKEETYIRKLELWKMVYLNIRKILVRYGLFMVGSTMSGLGTENSDIDMCLLVKPCLHDARSDALSYLQNIQNVLQNCDFVTQPEVILAKVPILKFKDSRYGFEVDLNCNNAVGIRNTHLLHCYAHLDWRVRPLVIVVKLWAQANNINDAKRMTISSYSLALMVIHFLQCGVTPPAIPCLHGLYPDKFSPNSEIHNIDIQEELPQFYSDNKQSLGELLLGFLNYYTHFDYDRYAISVREGSVLLKEECKYTRSQKNDVMQWKLLCIEEPFDLTNTARSVYDMETFNYIKRVFSVSYKLLGDTKNLNLIFPNVDMNPR
ncbi:hypothetical protein AMK59_7689 [Oryctes borbonicus]|uniref:Uncharacterized protein n=1 Tax=Oryctes borbonicus TaxID=1629725 RepID=A0A0T6ATH7_9SCAR|nr:hypothetical protein AMK59_7689 [Oryctes borbonicus]